MNAVRRANLLTQIRLTRTACLGPCRLGPIVVCYPAGTYYLHFKPEQAELLIAQLLDEAARERKAGISE